MLNVTQDSTCTCMYKFLLRLAAIEDALFGVTPGTQVHAEVPRTGQQAHGDMQVITCSCTKRIETAFPLTNKHDCTCTHAHVCTRTYASNNPCYKVALRPISV